MLGFLFIFLSYADSAVMVCLRAGDKFERWTILRTLSSPKPWRVHLNVKRSPYAQVNFCHKSTQFAEENCLKESDSLVFVLNVDARSEFLVYIFRGVACVQESGGFTASNEASPTSSKSNSVGEVPPQHGTNCKPSFYRRIMANHKRMWSHGQLSSSHSKVFTIGLQSPYYFVTI